MVMNTMKGTVRLNVNQMAIMLIYPVTGIPAMILWNKVYKTNMQVRETMMVASKWFSFTNKDNSDMINMKNVGR